MEDIKGHISKYLQIPNVHVSGINQIHLDDSFDLVSMAAHMIETDRNKSREILTREANLGNPMALYWMGLSYKIGLFTEINYIESYHYLFKGVLEAFESRAIIGESAFSACISEIFYELATVFEELIKKKDLSIYFYKNAINFGSVDAAIRLGEIYGTRGRYYNKKESLKYYLLARNRGASLCHIKS